MRQELFEVTEVLGLGSPHIHFFLVLLCLSVLLKVPLKEWINSFDVRELQELREI
jgi:hypothetical protein